MSIVELQPSHGLVPLVVVSMAVVNFWAAKKVGDARNKYGIAYPQMYAEQSDKNGKAFNCVQRAHQNLLENMSFFLALLFTSANLWRGPRAVFHVYVDGYASGEPKKRQRGSFGYLALLGSAVLTVEASLKIMGVL